MSDRLVSAGCDAQGDRDGTVFRVAARSLREMVELGDHQGITVASACALCRMLDAAARDAAGVEAGLRLALLRVADAIQDRRAWAPRSRALEESGPLPLHQ